MKILVAHDGSEQANKALREAATIAGKTGGVLNIVTVVPDLCLMEVSDNECKTITESLFSDAKGSMKKVADEIAARGIKAEILTKEGHPAERIIETIRETGADMVVVGAHGKHGAKKFLLGSVSSKVVEHAPCHVLVIK
ncbi:MAG: universal stress protein [Nitrospirota bacterium]